MELNKRKYKLKEVEEILKTNSFEYTDQIEGLKARIGELVEKNDILTRELEFYKAKEKNIVGALEKAKELEDQAKKDAEVYYQSVVDSLVNFSAKWSTYFSSLKEKYPMYPVIQEAVDLKEKLDGLLNANDNKATVKELNKEITQKSAFNPKAIISDYIASTNENGFNIEEVLNPGELKLEDLCLELGLIEQED